MKALFGYLVLAAFVIWCEWMEAREKQLHRGLRRDDFSCLWATAAVSRHR